MVQLHEAQVIVKRVVEKHQRQRATREFHSAKDSVSSAEKAEKAEKADKTDKAGGRTVLERHFSLGKEPKGGCSKSLVCFLGLTVV